MLEFLGDCVQVLGAILAVCMVSSLIFLLAVITLTEIGAIRKHIHQNRLRKQFWTQIEEYRNDFA